MLQHNVVSRRMCDIARHGEIDHSMYTPRTFGRNKAAGSGARPRRYISVVISMAPIPFLCIRDVVNLHVAFYSLCSGNYCRERWVGVRVRLMRPPVLPEAHHAMR